MKAQVSKENENNRISLIRDAIIGTSFHMPDPKVFIYPFTDYLYLLFQRPLVFNFWKKNDCVFSSFADPSFVPLYEEHLSKNSASDFVQIPKTPYSITIYNFGDIREDANASTLTSNIKKKTLNLPLHIDFEAMRWVKELLRPDAKFMRNVFKILKESLDINASLGNCHKLTQRTLPDDTLPRPDEIDYENILQLLKPLRQVIDEAFSEASKSVELIIKKGKNKEFQIPKIFTVVRTVNGTKPRYNQSFSYTAGLILSERQRKALREWCDHGCHDNNFSKKECCHLNSALDNDCLRLLENPLGLHSRSVADCVFSSGIVDFGRKAGDQRWDFVYKDDLNDVNRQKVENCVYPKNQKLFYTPIHVGGTPWLAIFTFTSESPAHYQEDWLYNYSFYRDVLHKAAALIRQKTEDVYTELLTNDLVECVKSWTKQPEAIVKEVNKKWQQLAQVYPYHMAKLHLDANKCFSIYIPGRGRFGLTMETNPFFPMQVEWKTFEKASIEKHCQNAIKRYAENETYIEASAIANSSHLLKVPLRELKVITTIHDESEKDKAINIQVDKILDLHNFGSYIISKKKPHSHMSSLKSFISIFKKRCNETVKFLAHPEVSGNRAKLLDKILKDNLFLVELPENRSLCNKDVKYYDELINVTLDGLLTNALSNIDRCNPTITVKISELYSKNESLIFMKVINSTFLKDDDLSNTVDELNSGRPDFIGVTNIFWACDICWSEKPIWSYDKKMITVKVPIAEIQK